MDLLIGVPIFKAKFITMKYYLLFLVWISLELSVLMSSESVYTEFKMFTFFLIHKKVGNLLLQFILSSLLKALNNFQRANIWQLFYGLIQHLHYMITGKGTNMGNKHTTQIGRSRNAWLLT